MTDPHAPTAYPSPPGHPPAQANPGPGYPPQGNPVPAGAPMAPGYPQQGYPQQGYPQQGYPQQGYAGTPQYEFSEVENTTIERASAWSKALAVLFFINAGLQVINLNIISLAIYVGIGVAFWKASKSLAAVVETQGNDIGHLMDALKALSNAFMIRLIVVGIGVGLLLVIGVIVALVVA